MDVLTKEDKERVLAALKDAELLRKEIAKAKRAGLDVTDIETALTEAQAKLEGIRRVYISPTANLE